MANFETDRSAILSWQKCPRDRFYSRHFNGTGIERVKKSLPLIFGGGFHEGAEEMLVGNGVEAAVIRAKRFLDDAFTASKVDLEEKQTEFAVSEQKAIAEGLIRAWWVHNGERFLRDFEVISVEEEGRAELAPGLILMFRPDALVREKLTGDLYIVSWKTASTFGQYTLNSIATDMQSMSEVWGVEHTFARLLAGNEMKRIGDDDIPAANIEGVLYLFAVKGQRKMDDWLGFKVQNTPLAYGWMKLGNTPEESEWSWQYSWQTEEINSKTGKPVKTTLGKGWKRVPIWSEYPGGVKAWVEALAANEIAPRHINPFEQIFPESLPISRRGDEIESWRRQVVSQESRIRQRVLAVEMAGGDEETLDREFPQHTARCFDYQSKCSFYDICFNPVVKSDPLASGLYQIRLSNHPEKGDGE